LEFFKILLLKGGRFLSLGLVFRLALQLSMIDGTSDDVGKILLIILMLMTVSGYFPHELHFWTISLSSAAVYKC